MTDVNTALNQEAGVLPEKKSKNRSPYTYLLLYKNGESMAAAEFNSRKEVADFVSEELKSLDRVIKTFKTCGELALQEKKVITFSL